MYIRSMIQTDVAEVALLESLITPSPWSSAMFSEEIELGSYCRILEGASGRIVGYSVARLHVDEWHLLTLGIALFYRRQGGAKRLLDDLIQQVTIAGGKAILLEVRDSNLPARTLYRDMGFHFLYTRRGYYRSESSTEDAILLIRYFD